MSKENGRQDQSLIDPVIAQALVIESQLQEDFINSKKLEAANLKRAETKNVPFPTQGVIIDNGQINKI